MNALLPQTVSAKDIQRNYREVFNKAKETKKPVVVLTNNTPDVAIVDIKSMEELMEKAEKTEMKDALKAIKIYKKEKAVGKLKKLNSLADLM